MSTLTDLNHQFDNASPEEQKAHRKHVLSLGQPSSKAVDAIWFLILLILAGVIFVGVWLGTVRDGSDETALYGSVGLALGAVVGLLSPAPPSNR